ncbi:hypothetical protein BJX63DRAFT_409797 [Aspergillus granulosus]|uniref:Uncharacterized protein n=1 Tax=Aspergillus granulosus TaxID=176169 RepID=A0ABR4GYF8_9EURO
MASYEDIPLESFEVLEGVAPAGQSLHDQNAESADETHNTSSPVNSSPGSEGIDFLLYTASSLAVSSPNQDYCYHSTVSRQWRIDEYETCDSCGNRPHFRWFYLCTEDTSGYSDSVGPDGSFLSPWITDAILAGEYSDAQRGILLKQKLGVIEMCERERRQAQARPSFGHEDRTVHSSRCLNRSIPPIHPRPARCRYRVCHHCDRRLQERAWLSINAVCNDPNIEPPSTWDLWATPVSDATIVSNLGLRRSAPPQSQFSQYVYRGVQCRRGQDVSENYSVDYDPSSDFSGLMRRLSTIEEISEEMEVIIEMG